MDDESSSGGVLWLCKKHYGPSVSLTPSSTSSGYTSKGNGTDVRIRLGMASTATLHSVEQAG